MNAKRIVLIVAAFAAMCFASWFYLKPTTMQAQKDEYGYPSISFHWDSNENLEVLLKDQNALAQAMGTSNDYFLALKANRQFEGSAVVMPDGSLVWEQTYVPIEPGVWVMRKGEADVNIAGSEISAITLSPTGLRMWTPLITCALSIIIICGILWGLLRDPVPQRKRISRPLQPSYGPRTSNNHVWQYQDHDSSPVPQRMRDQATRKMPPHSYSINDTSPLTNHKFVTTRLEEDTVD